MARHLSSSQIDRLGRRLRHTAVATASERHELRRLIADYAEPLRLVQDRVRSRLGLASTARLKTEKTILEKLRRERTALSRMQDIAGLRMVVPGTRVDQADTARQVRRLFRSVERVDRIARPKHGYRAIHLIVTLRGCPVEVQIRTSAQHAWADAYEKVADRIGRGIRYGDMPAAPAVREVVETMLQAADQIDLIERSHAEAVAGATELAGIQEALAALPKAAMDPAQRQELAARAQDLQRRRADEIAEHEQRVDHLVRLLEGLSEALS